MIYCKFISNLCKIQPQAKASSFFWLPQKVGNKKCKECTTKAYGVAKEIKGNA